MCEMQGRQAMRVFKATHNRVALSYGHRNTSAFFQRQGFEYALSKIFRDCRRGSGFAAIGFYIERHHIQRNPALRTVLNRLEAPFLE